MAFNSLLAPSLPRLRPLPPGLSQRTDQVLSGDELSFAFPLLGMFIEDRPRTGPCPGPLLHQPVSCTWAAQETFCALNS